MIDLTDQQIKEIKTIIEIHSTIPLEAFYVFGSRAKNSARTYSDLDLLIDTAKNIPLTEIFKLRDAFEASNLPFRVDIVDRKRISDEFFNAISNTCTPLCSGGAGRE